MEHINLVYLILGIIALIYGVFSLFSPEEVLEKDLSKIPKKHRKWYSKVSSILLLIFGAFWIARTSPRIDDMLGEIFEPYLILITVILVVLLILSLALPRILKKRNNE